MVNLCTFSKLFPYICEKGIITEDIFLFGVEMEEEMSKEVIIKSNRYGLKLILDKDLPFPKLLHMICVKFRERDDFFKNVQMPISFENRELTVEEEQEIVDAITQNSHIQIVSIIDNDRDLEDRMRAELSVQQEPEKNENGRDFYKGNLRSGQVLESDSSITIIGDVNPGAKIISNGNIVILGSLKGNAHAGANGNQTCFIFALEMRPIQLQIGDLIAKCPDKDSRNRYNRKKEKNVGNNQLSQIAVAKDGSIYIEPMTKGCLNHL